MSDLFFVCVREIISEVFFKHWGIICQPLAIQRGSLNNDLCFSPTFQVTYFSWKKIAIISIIIGFWVFCTSVVVIYIDYQLQRPMYWPLWDSTRNMFSVRNKFSWCKLLPVFQIWIKTFFCYSPGTIMFEFTYQSIVIHRVKYLFKVNQNTSCIFTVI